MSSIASATDSFKFDTTDSSAELSPGIHVITGTLDIVEFSVVTGGSGDGIWIEATAGPVNNVLHNDLGNNIGFGLRNDSAPLIIAERNWWGNNLAANVAAEVSGNADFDPWLASGTDVGVAFGLRTAGPMRRRTPSSPMCSPRA